MATFKHLCLRDLIIITVGLLILAVSDGQLINEEEWFCFNLPSHKHCHYPSRPDPALSFTIWYVCGGKLSVISTSKTLSYRFCLKQQITCRPSNHYRSYNTNNTNTNNYYHCATEHHKCDERDDPGASDDSYYCNNTNTISANPKCYKVSCNRALQF